MLACLCCTHCVLFFSILFIEVNPHPSPCYACFFFTLHYNSMTSRPTDSYPCLCCLYFSLIAVAVYLEVWKCIVMFTCVLCFQVALLWHCSKRCESTLVHCNVHLRVEFYFQVHSVPRCSVALLWHCTKRCESRSPPSRIVSTDIQEFSLSLSLWPPSYITLNTFDTLPSSPIYTIQLLNFKFSVLVPLHYAEVEKQG